MSFVCASTKHIDLMHSTLAQIATALSIVLPEEEIIADEPPAFRHRKNTINKLHRDVAEITGQINMITTLPTAVTLGGGRRRRTQKNRNKRSKNRY